MPVQGMVAYEAQNGSLVFMSKNGRYVFQGKVTDVWAANELISGEQVYESTSTLPFETMGVNFDDYDALTLGTGSRTVHVITDPLCPACAKLSEAMVELKGEYTFKILVLPALGGKSADLAARVACEKDRERALQALLEKRTEELPSPQNCNFDALQSASLVSDLIGIDAVPYVVAPNGKISRGMPKKINEWLSENSDAKAVAGQPMSVTSLIDNSSPEQASGTGTTINQKLLNALK
nr:DsbC family protein [Hydrocarboniclastica marina]